MKSFRSLKLQINLILLVVTVLAFFVVGGLTGMRQYTLRMDEATEVMSRQSSIVKNFIGTHLAIEHERFEALGRELQGHTLQEIVEQLRQRLYPVIMGNIIYVLDSHSQVVLINPELDQFLGFDLAHMPYRKDNQAVSNAYQSVFSNRSVVALVYPLTAGLSLVVERDVRSILSEMGTFSDEFAIHGVTLVVMDQEGKAIYHPDQELVRSRHNLAFDLKTGAEKGNGLVPAVYLNQSYYVYGVDLDMPAGWRAVLLLPFSHLMNELTKVVLFQLFAVFLLCVFLALALGFFLNRFFSMPVQNIVTHLEAYGAEPKGESVPADIVEGIVEFQQIGAAINRMAESVNQSRTQLASILDSMDALVYVADMETYEILFINDCGRRIWGDIQGKVCWQTIQDGQTGPCPFCTNSRLLDADGQPTGVYAWEVQNTKTETWYDCRDQAILWSDGRLVRMEIATDISEKKEASKHLQESRELLHSIFQTAPIGIGIVVDRVFTLVNLELVRITGFREEELLGEKSRMIYPSDEEFERVGREKYAQIQKGGTGAVETRFQRKDGGIIDVLLSSTPLDPDDLGRGVLFTVLDITTRKHAEQSLQEQHILLEKLVKERTRELKKKNEELERLNTYYVDREFRIKELKMTIDRLKGKRK
ncbi:MAG: PAS domain S-box protein [Desulfobulbaceae bacterium]|uniref:PAS domain S-box protein n=1 Tax=Candidatus Desulfobia pelagia TaxID=2841692 RepID=A0A8J6NEX5_9BACT|nr:PAS domain S-box protein [Candidatus Desulfobia pelagia]